MSMEMTALTVSDRGDVRGRDFDYPRVVGYVDPESGERERLADIPYRLAELCEAEMVLSLSETLGVRFLETVRSMRQSRHPAFTCHTFARALTGVPTPFDPFINRFRPAELTTAPDMRLDMGQVGMVASAQGFRPFHSLVGLGMDSELSLQVLSAGGELTVVETAKVVDSYAAGCDRTALYRYEAATGASDLGGLEEAA